MRFKISARNVEGKHLTLFRNEKLSFEIVRRSQWMMPCRDDLRSFRLDPALFLVSSKCKVTVLGAGDVKEPACLSQRVGHEFPGVLVRSLLLY